MPIIRFWHVIPITLCNVISISISIAWMILLLADLDIDYARIELEEISPGWIINDTLVLDFSYKRQ